jgi:hypothetical protein
VYNNIKRAVDLYAELAYTRGVIIGMVYAFRRPVTYAELAGVLGKSSQNLGVTLSHLIDVDVESKQPLVSALVVNGRNQRPGPGFFMALAKHDPRVNERHTDNTLMEHIWRTHLSAFPGITS